MGRRGTDTWGGGCLLNQEGAAPKTPRAGVGQGPSSLTAHVVARGDEALREGDVGVASTTTPHCYCHLPHRPRVLSVWVCVCIGAPPLQQDPQYLVTRETGTPEGQVGVVLSKCQLGAPPPARLQET